MGRARTPQVGDFPIDWTPDLRERYTVLCTYYPWLADVNEAYQFRMASQSVYRPAFVFGKGRSANEKPTNPWRELDQATVEAWRGRDLGNRWATTDKTARALAWLEQEFSP